MKAFFSKLLSRSLKMKARSILSLFACATMFAIATSSWAGGQRLANTLPNGDPAPKHQAQSSSGIPGCNGQVAAIHPNLLKTMPAEACVVAYAPPLGFACDENGNRVNAHGGVKWVCVKYATHQEKFLAVFQPGASGSAKIVRVAANSREGWESRHELWATGENTAVTWMSDRASGLYASNGGDQDQLVVAGRNNSPSTQPAPVQQAKADCGRLGFAQRIVCEAGNNAGLGAAIGAGVRAFGK